jgi:SAM-dependent methyltransferase
MSLQDSKKSLNGQAVTSSDGVEWLAQPSRCPLCEGDSFRRVGKRGGAFHRDRKGVESEVVQCKECSLFYTNPTLIPLTNPYEVAGEGYFVGSAHDPVRKIRDGEAFTARIEELLNGRKGVILEAACGKGEFLRGAINRGWKARGVEMTPYFAESARDYGIEIETAPIEDSRFLEKANSCDAIFMLAMLEHLYDPLLMLRKANNILVSDGIALINVPNEVTSLVNQLGNRYVKLMYGRDWTMSLSPTFSPFHVVGFSPQSLKHALEMTGFEVIAMETASGTNDLPAARDLRQRVERLAMSASLLVGKISDKLNRGNEIMCWARKRSDTARRYGVLMPSAH